MTAGLLVTVATPAIEGRCGAAYMDELDQKIEIMLPNKPNKTLKDHFEKIVKKTLRELIEKIAQEKYDGDAHYTIPMKYGAGLVKNPDALPKISVDEAQRTILKNVKIINFLNGLHRLQTASFSQEM